MLPQFLFKHTLVATLRRIISIILLFLIVLPLFLLEVVLIELCKAVDFFGSGAIIESGVAIIDDLDVLALQVLVMNGFVDIEQ